VHRCRVSFCYEMEFEAFAASNSATLPHFFQLDSKRRYRVGRNGKKVKDEERERKKERYGRDGGGGGGGRGDV
jgi:hypothetical protein